MKTIMLSTLSFTKKMFAMLALAVITLSSAFARTGDSTIGDDNASVACLRVEDGQVFFNVKFENANGSRFDILVNDATGDNLYHATFNDKNFNRVFRAPVENGRL